MWNSEKVLAMSCSFKRLRGPRGDRGDAGDGDGCTDVGGDGG